MNDVDPELQSLLDQREAERIAALRAEYDAMTPQQRRESYSLPERLSRRWRERSPDDKVNKAIFILVVAALIVIVGVLAAGTWLVVTLLT